MATKNRTRALDEVRRVLKTNRGVWMATGDVTTAAEIRASSTASEALRKLVAEEGIETRKVGRVTQWRFPRRTAAKPAQSVAAATDTAAQSDTPARSGRQRVADVSGTAAAMSAARPVSAPPAPAPSNGRRSHNGPVARGEMSAWPRGGLKTAVAGHYQGKPDEQLTPTQVAKALGGQTGSVAFACETLTKEGVLKLAVEKPKTYQAV